MGLFSTETFCSCMRGRCQASPTAESVFQREGGGQRRGKYCSGMVCLTFVHKSSLSFLTAYFQAGPGVLGEGMG